MTKIFKGTCCSIALSVACSLALPAFPQTPNDSAAYVVVESSAKGTSYCVGGTECVFSGQVLPHLEIMKKLATALRNGGKGQLLAIIIAPNVGVGTADQVSEVAQKVGFERVRIFVENENRNRIREITPGKSYAAPSTGEQFLRLDDGHQQR